MDSAVMEKRLYIENLGCAKNQVDGEVVAQRLADGGWTLVDEVEEATLIYVNTCGFIESAKQESIDTTLELRKRNPSAKLIVGGCLAQRYPNVLADSLAECDGVFGNRDLGKVASFVQEVLSTSKKPVLVPDYPAPCDEYDKRTRHFNYPGSAYLKISEGCNHRCAYCAIPLIRGELRSRPEEAVLEDARNLVSQGVKEINIIAQDLAAYGSDWDGKSHFCDLVGKIAAIEGDFRIRMLYIHPDAFPEELISTVKDNPKIMPYFDIPFQHADESVLKPMKRTGNADKYAALVARIREALPDAVIRTTIMLGFPGDSKKAFDTVCGFVQRCRFNWMGSFLYSREDDTPAWSMTDAGRHRRLVRKASKWQSRLQDIQEGITAQMLETFVGREMDVLIEEKVEGEDLCIGRIYAQAPEVDGLTVVMGRDMKPGCVYKCGITKVNGVDLEAVKVD